MSVITLIVWLVAGACGLYLVSVWLIEYDREYQSAAATRLRPSVLASHVTLAVGGLVLWVAYLIYDADSLVRVSLLILVAAAALGVFMAIRWISVYQQSRARVPARGEPVAMSGSRGGGKHAAWQWTGTISEVPEAGPPERNFPLPVVVAHGAFAGATLILVALTAFGVFGS